MALFKQVATEQFKVLFFAFVLGNGFHAVPLPADPADNACRSDFYPRLLTTHYFLAFYIFASAMLLLAVRMAIDTAEAGAIAAARAARGSADHAAAVMGLASVPAGWKRRSLRVLLSLAVHLSGGATFVAIVAFEDGYHYRTGCHAQAPYRVGWPFYILMLLLVAVHGFSAWVAENQNWIHVVIVF